MQSPDALAVQTALCCVFSRTCSLPMFPRFIKFHSVGRSVHLDCVEWKVHLL